MGMAWSVQRVGGSLLDMERGVLRRSDGTETALRRKTLDLLLLLLRNPGRVVARGEILDAVWPEVNVTDDSITQCIVEIRRALGPDAALLKTVPRRGYLLENAPAAAVSGPAAAAPPAAEAPVVAVMPFRLGLPDPDLALFAQGVQEGVVGALAALRGPLVISAHSTQRMGATEADPLRIGARLGADYVAAGTVRRSGRRIRLSLELADARSAAALWHRTFDVSDGEDFDTQDRIAAAIADSLAPRLQEVELTRGRARRPAEAGGYQLLLQAQHLVFRMERDALEQEGGLPRRAAAPAPGVPSVRAADADRQAQRAGLGWPEDGGAGTRPLAAEAAPTGMPVLAGGGEPVFLPDPPRRQPRRDDLPVPLGDAAIGFAGAATMRSAPSPVPPRG